MTYVDSKSHSPAKELLNWVVICKKQTNTDKSVWGWFTVWDKNKKGCPSTNSINQFDKDNQDNKTQTYLFRQSKVPLNSTLVIQVKLAASFLLILFEELSSVFNTIASPVCTRHALLANAFLVNVVVVVAAEAVAIAFSTTLRGRRRCRIFQMLLCLRVRCFAESSHQMFAGNQMSRRNLLFWFHDECR